MIYYTDTFIFLIIYTRIIILYSKNFFYPNYIKYTRQQLLNIFDIIYIKIKFKNIISVEDFLLKEIFAVTKKSRININFNNNSDASLNIFGKDFYYINKQQNIENIYYNINNLKYLPIIYNLENIINSENLIENLANSLNLINDKSLNDDLTNDKEII